MNFAVLSCDFAFSNWWLDTNATLKYRILLKKIVNYFFFMMNWLFVLQKSVRCDLKNRLRFRLDRKQLRLKGDYDYVIHLIFFKATTEWALFLFPYNSFYRSLNRIDPCKKQILPSVSEFMLMVILYYYEEEKELTFIIYYWTRATKYSYFF